MSATDVALKSEALSFQGRGEGKIYIVVLQRGWVFVGRFFQAGEQCRLENASCIRVWGTTRGLTQLVLGPVEGQTVLDPTPYSVEFHALTVCFKLLCLESAWSRYLL